MIRKSRVYNVLYFVYLFVLSYVGFLSFLDSNLVSMTDDCISPLVIQGDFFMYFVRILHVLMGNDKLYEFMYRFMNLS